MRSYEGSHPWITFQLDTGRLPPRTWIALGEAQSKCEHLAGAPLPPALAKEMHRLYLAKGVLATTAIEGNTLSEEEVQAHLDGRLQLPPSKQYLAQEIDNVVGASQDILDNAVNEATIPLTPALIKTFNRQILYDLELEEDVVPGEIRRHSVTVGAYRGAPAEDCDTLLERLCEWLEELSGSTADDAINSALVRSILAHLYLAWIHPFGDGNGRTARLIEVKLLLDAGVPAAAAHLLSNHYNETRTRYYRELAAASRSGGDIIPFLDYAITGFVDQLRAQVGRVREEQLIIAWRDFVYEQFSESTSPSDKRRIRLILALSQATEPVPKAALRRLTPDLAEIYASRTNRTLSRDVNVLKEMELVVDTPQGLVANKRLVSAFLSPRRS